MKKVFLSLLGVGMVVFFNLYGYTVGNQVYTNYGTYYEAQTPDNSAVTVSTSAVTTSEAVDQGVIRIYTNIGTNPIFEVKESTNNVTTTGQPIYQNDVYIEDKYFGDIYFQSTVGDSEMRIEIIQQNTY